MTATEMDGNEFTTFSEADRIADRFEEVMRERGFPIRQGSTLEEHCLLLKDLVEKQHNERARIPGEDVRTQLSKGAGILDLFRKVVRRSSHLDFASVAAHLSVLNEKGWLPQNVSSAPTDQIGNKVFELLLALAVMGLGTGIELDDPLSSHGDNPDVLINIGPSCWGFACKVMHGQSAMTLFERILEGMEQIEASRADTGIVVLNFRNRLPHDDLFVRRATPGAKEAELGIYLDPRQACDELAVLCYRALDEMEAHVTRDAVGRAIAGRKALPAVAVIAQTTVGSLTSAGPTTTHLRTMVVRDLLEHPAWSAPVKAQLKVLTMLNDALQDRL